MQCKFFFDIYIIENISSVAIAENSSTPITATFKVPCNATVGDVSTIVVTATSDLDGTQNSAVTRLVVISDVRYLFNFIRIYIGFYGIL